MDRGRNGMAGGMKRRHDVSEREMFSKGFFMNSYSVGPRLLGCAVDAPEIAMIGITLFCLR